MQRLISLSIIILLGSLLVHSQEVNINRFTNYLEGMPLPMPTLKETMAVNGNTDQLDKWFGNSNKMINESLRFIYTPLLQMFKSRITNMKQPSPESSGNEEQLLLGSFKSSIEGVPENGMLDILLLVMDYNRPSHCIGKLSWTRLNPNASEPVGKLYRQLIDLEEQFDWTGYSKQVKDHHPKFGESDDKKSIDLHTTFDKAFKVLPKRKVKLMEGVIEEVADPDKAIVLLEQYSIDLDKAAEEWYQLRYQWWRLQHDKLSSISKRLYALAIQAGSLMQSNADRSIEPAIAEMQARTWEAWQKLSLVTQGFFTEAIVAASGKIQIYESIKIYRSYKQGSE